MSEPKTEAWLIEWEEKNGRRRALCGHNSIADYRVLCGKRATSTELVRREALEAARKEGYEEGLRAAAEKMTPLYDERINEIAESMPGGLEGFLKGWGWQQFARAVEDEHGIGANFE